MTTVLQESISVTNVDDDLWLYIYICSYPVQLFIMNTYKFVLYCITGMVSL